jgi:hydroxypyruvate isomerase
MDRRKLLKLSGATAAASTLACNSVSNAADNKENPFKKSYVSWCYNKVWSLEKQISEAVHFGCQGLELVAPKKWNLLKKSGLECNMVKSHTFVRGMNNKLHWDECFGKLRESIDNASAAGFPNVISFTGFADTTTSKGSKVHPEEGQKTCIEAYKKIIGYAEKKNVKIQIEVLNSRVKESMKGHPGYAGDTVEYIGEIIRAVGSPNLKILFDIYHVQVMQGDLIKRIHDNKDIIGHIHTAGCPGRAELDDTQEINYSAVLKALDDIGYREYVSHEFIPTRDPHQGLVEAFELCKVK